MDDKKFVVIYTFASYAVIGRFEVDLTDTPVLDINENTAAIAFKRIRHKGNVKGKAFLMHWGGKTFFITRTGKDLTVYALEFERTQERRDDA